MNRKVLKYQAAVMLAAVCLCSSWPAAEAESEIKAEIADSDRVQQAADNGNATEDGVLTIRVDGEEWLFYLESAKLYPSLEKMAVTYYAFTPRGETYYKLRLSLSDGIKPGEYETNSAEVSIAFYTDDTTGKNGAVQNINAQFMSGGRTTGTLVVEKRSSDWMTYKGSFETDVANYAGEKIHIECNSFEFTLGEERELPYQNDWEEDSGSTTDSFQNSRFF